MLYQIIDMHTHFLSQEEDTKIIQEGLDNGIKAFSLCTASPKQAEWEKLLHFSHKFPTGTIIPSFGVHPWQLSQTNSQWEKELAPFIATPCHGLGEIGLDRCHKNLSLQEHFLKKQLALAIQYQTKLITIHCVHSYDRLFPILKKYREKISSSYLVLHSFHGSPELIRQLISIDVYFSLSGNFLRIPQQKQLKMIQQIPDNRILIESDGKGFFLLQKINQKIAELKFLSIKEAAQLTFQNALSIVENCKRV